MSCEDIDEVDRKMKRILFVEDDRSLLQGLSFALKKQGYVLTAARTREEGERLWTWPCRMDPDWSCAGKSEGPPGCQ